MMLPKPRYPEIVVPVVERPPEDPPRHFDVQAFTAYLITMALRHQASELHADFRVDGNHWCMRGNGIDEVVAVTRSQWEFRAVLAHLGTCYLTEQMHGGYGEITINQLGQLSRFLIHIGNDQWRGYWVRAFTLSEPRPA